MTLLHFMADVPPKRRPFVRWMALWRHSGRTRPSCGATRSTFRYCANAYIAARKDGWKNAKHAAQWAATLETYAMPIIGDLPVQAVDVTLVHRILDPIWSAKTETASRVRGRIESILDWATVREFRMGDNPARWKGHLENLFQRRSKVQKVEHHPALPYAELVAFMAGLRTQEGIGALALQFTILRPPAPERLPTRRGMKSTSVTACGLYRPTG